MHINTPSYKSFFDSMSKEQRTDFARLKRFLERWSGDPDFRRGVELAEGSEEFIRNQIGFDFDVTEIAPLIDKSAANIKVDERTWPLVHLWRRYILSARDFRNELRSNGNSAGRTPDFDKWRLRQMNRAAFELGVTSSSIVHAPITFELSDGCSVGCWFCGISAEKFKGHFDIHADGNREFWLGVLTQSKDILGAGVGAGFCYWATDPLDNPSYCELADDFASIAGSYPQVTTAIPLRDPALTRRSLESRTGAQIFPNRFSVLTTSILRRIHNTFSPEELINVELVMQNKGALRDAKAIAGKARLKTKVIPIENSNTEGGESKPRDGGTIACVSGFLVNLVSKTIKLISPTNATDVTPNGYYIFDEMSFTTVESFGECLRQLISNNMQQKVSANKIVRFGEFLNVLKGPGGIELASGTFKAKFPHSDALVEAICEGAHTPNEIVKQLARQEINPLKTIYLIDSLWKGGLIESMQAR